MTAFACALALAAPSTALGQGAGDEQYTDPFGSDQETQEPAPTATPAPAAPAPAPTAAPATAAQAPPPSAAQPQLPRTGSATDAGLLALAGGVLIAGGVALRVRVRDPR
jgi:2-oxoglutarate dehydrogenase E2 component (dihydrolipoamide succinyltransferase)